MSLQSVFCLENRPREDEIVAWKSKAVGMSCLTYAILLRYFSRGRGGGARCEFLCSGYVIFCL